MVPPLVSVVVPLFNGRRFLLEALVSVAAQSHRPVEAVVVDDGSTDGGGDLARAAGARVVRQRNAGVAAARNRGVDEARGELLLFLDQDDRLLPRAVEAGLAALRASPWASWTVGGLRKIDADGQPRAWTPPPRGGLDALTMLRGRTGCGGPPARALFPRALVLAAGGFDARHAPADDYDLFVKVARRGRGVWHDEDVVEYRRHDGNQSNAAARTLRATLGVLAAHAAAGDAATRAACAEGRAHWRRVFGPHLLPEARQALRRGRLLRAASAALCKVECALARG